MLRREFLSKSTQLVMVSGVAVKLTGCGTILHSERVGQPHSRDIDWKVAGMNGLGLILFFVPGVVAFVVDFYTGAIYLPDESLQPIEPGQGGDIQRLSQGKTRLQYHNKQNSKSFAGTFQKIRIPAADKNLKSIEDIVSKKIGHSIQVDDGKARVSKLAKLDQFSKSYQRHLGDPDFGQPTHKFFEDLPTA